MLGLLVAAALQATEASSTHLATRAWAACAERAAPFVARTDETVTTATELALDLCPSEYLALGDALDLSRPDPMRRSEDMAALRKVAGARARLRIVFERACPIGDSPCEVFFRESLGFVR